MGGLFGGGNKPVTTTSESTTTNKHHQQGQYDTLLGAADAFLQQSQNAVNPNYINQMGQALGSQGQHYMNVLSGEVDRTALNNALQGQADAMNTQLSRGRMRDIGLSSVGAGNSNSSRRSIAEGIAIGDANAALAQQQANTINQFEQQQIQNQMAAAQGMGQVMGQIGQLQQLAQANTPEAIRLKNLLAYQQLISGDMGGTTHATGTNTEVPQQQGGGLLGGIGTVAGTVIGGIYGGPAGAAAGGAAGGALGGALDSDKRLKKNIKPKRDKRGKVMKTKDGIRKVEWDWNEKGEYLGNKGRGEGVIAQEVAKKKPSAVKKGKSGYLQVDYSKL